MCLYSQITSEPRDRNSSVGIATRLQTSQSEFRILAWTRAFSLLQIFLTDFGALPTSGALVKEKWRYTSNLLMTYMLDVKDNPLKATS